MRINPYVIVLFCLLGTAKYNMALCQPIINGQRLEKTKKSSGFLQLSYPKALNSDVKNPYSPIFYLARDKQTYYFCIQIKQMNTYPPVDTTSCAAVFFKTADGQDIVFKRKSGKSALFAKVDRSWRWGLTSMAAPYYNCCIYLFYEIEDINTFTNTLYNGYSLLDGMIQSKLKESTSKKFKKALTREKKVVDEWYNAPRNEYSTPPPCIDLNYDYEHPAWDANEEDILKLFWDS